MAIKCPKCQTDNPDTIKFCGECGTQLIPTEEVSAPTETLEAAREELTRGTTFANRYEIIEELGKGGMGKVYRVEDKKIKEEVALKLIKPEIASDKKTIERFSNELKMARKIAHRNVCKMYDLGEEKGTHYITMEYVPGEDLKSFIRRARQLTPGTVITIAKQVCEGLTEAHRLGVVHRDLKPQNLMIDKEGNARIMDFGIARSIIGKGITGAGVMIGTPEYMSPEQAEVKEVDQRSDIYSLGVILYEMVTGRVPFEGETPFSIAFKHKSEIPRNPKEVNSQIPDDLSRVILRCLEKDKEKRYQSAGEVRSELENIEKGIPTTERVVPKRKPITAREITVTFGLKKLFIPAFVVISVAIIGIIIWQLLPQKETVFTPKIKNSIAVISFENQTGDNAFDYLQKAIPNLLITSLEQTGNLYVATWERLRDLLKQMGKEDTKVIESDLGFGLCRREGIEFIVLGSFIKAGDIFATDVKILDVETKKLLKSASSKGEGVDSILKTQIDELSSQISQGIGISREKIEASQVQISDITTTSMEAYNYFLDGREAAEKLYYGEARKFFERAIHLDSTFAWAYLWLSRAHSSLGDVIARNEACEKAKIFSEKATEKERLYIEADYARYLEGNREKEFSILKRIAENYPREKRVLYLLGSYHQGNNLFDEAIREHNKALELDPNYGLAFNNLGIIYRTLGDYDKAIEYFEKYAQASPGDANPLDSTGVAYLFMGRLDDAIAKFKEALEIKPDFFWTLRSISYAYALKEDYTEAVEWAEQYIERTTSLGRKAEGYLWKGFYHYWVGAFDQSARDLRKAIDLSVEVGNKSWNSVAEWLNGFICYSRGDFELARKHLETWFDLAKESQPELTSYSSAVYSWVLGLLDLKEDRTASAKKRLVEIRSILPRIEPFGKNQVMTIRDILEGEILIAEGSFDKAIAVLKKTSILKFRQSRINLVVGMNTVNYEDTLARAYQHKGEIDKAISVYEKRIRIDPNSDDRCLIHPLNYYRLAKLYERQGNKTKAIEQYEKFLSLWKDADPGIAEVSTLTEDARKRLASLK
ncbi:MAG: protein kinase [Candidatus Aminicenantes bacterium]|nr:protein kinase [Candidatus Aminicenantes bacterium]